MPENPTYKITTVYITAKQAKWIDENYINFSKLVRVLLDKYISEVPR